MYNHIFITNYEIGHVSLQNTTDKQTLDAVTEYYIMSNSEHIHSISYPVLASLHKKIPITCHFDFNNSSYNYLLIGYNAKYINDMNYS